MTESVSAALKRPFPEQVAALRLRLGNLVPTQAWDDLRGVEHDRGFMVAGAMKADLLAELAAAVDAAVAGGESLEQFRLRFREIVATHGWHGWTGEGTKAGEAWRTRVIYRTNTATTYAAGRWAQLKEGGFPFWVYRHGNSREPRLQHLAWDHLVLSADDPFWQSHYPPNGWGCSCYAVGARSEAGARRVGGDPSKPFDPAWRDVDPKTGEPVGISKGWGHAPGSTIADTVTSLRAKLDQLPEQPSIDLIQSWLRLHGFSDWLGQPTGAWPIARLSAADATRLGADSVVADLTAEQVRAHVVQHADLTAADYAQAQAVISGARRVASDGPATRVYLSRDPKSGTVTLVSVTQKGGALVVTGLRKLAAADAAGDPQIMRLFGDISGG